MNEEHRLAFYRLLMSQRPESRREIREDAFCRGCRNHRPDWKYRFCAFTECSEMKGMSTFREAFREEN